MGKLTMAGAGLAAAGLVCIFGFQLSVAGGLLVLLGLIALACSATADRRAELRGTIDRARDRVRRR